MSAERDLHGQEPTVPDVRPNARQDERQQQDEQQDERRDALARAAALDPTRSLLLQAPAGSGKTTVLTARFLALLATVDAPEQVLAITFTRKAAAEMRQRILAALSSDAREPPRGLSAELILAVRERCAARGWNLLHNPARLRVETIDALNGRLARTLPVAARCAPSLTIAPTPQTLYELAARRALEGAWHDPARQPAARLLYERLDDDWQRLQGLLAQMLAQRSHWLPRVLEASGTGLVRRVHDSLDALIGDALAAMRECLTPPLLQEAQQLLTAVGDGSPAAAPAAAPAPAPTADRGATPGTPPVLDAHPASLGHWRSLRELLLTKEGTWRSRLDSRQGLNPDDRELKQRVLAFVSRLAQRPQVRERLHELRRLPDARFCDDDERALEALAQLLIGAALQLQIVFADSAQIDFPYIAGAARASLVEQGEPSEMALRAGNALRHILVDEFQDTSREQFQLIEALTASWERDEGRTLFLVGDPMQSIYQFRDAEVGLFLEARDHGVGAVRLQPLRLRRNFRTRAPLLAWINRHFAALFPAADDARRAAIRYAASVAAASSAGGRARPEEPGPEGSPVTLYRFDPADRPAEAQAVVQIVRAARSRAPAASIAVLVASREHATFIVAALRAAGVPLQGVELEPLRERAVVRDLAALTRALLHPADRTAWFSVLRAPWCGLTLAQLEMLGADEQGDMFGVLQEAATGSTLFADAADALQRVSAALAPALQGAERTLPLWQRVENCWLRLAGPVIYRLPDEQADARRFLDALAQQAAPDALVGDSLQDMLRSLYSVAPPEPLAVQIMTMHAAKGLEWDVVILPGLGRQTKSDPDPLLHWIDLSRGRAEPQLLLAPIRGGERERPASLAAYIKWLRRERLRLERVRLLYVAVTRARSALHLLGALPAPSGDAAPLPAAGSALELLWPAIGPEFAALSPGIPAARSRALPAESQVKPQVEASVTAPTSPAHQAADAAADALWRLDGAWRLPLPPPAPQPSRLRLPAAEASPRPEYSWVGLAARAIGTIVHAELHRLSLLPALPEPTEIPPEAGYHAWLAELGVEAHEQAAAAARIAQALRRTLADARGRWLLSHEHHEAHSEWRLTGVYQGRILNVILDRMLIDEHGQRWIIDFKTGTHEGGSLELFLTAEVQRYREQLLRYAALARELGPEPVRVALYFPLLGEFRELPQPDGDRSGPLQ
jgi:ATP-dependent helicase/nuclease subunit A